MKRVFTIVLSLIIIVSACVCVSAANTDRAPSGEKVVFKVNGWAYEKVRNYGYEIDEYYGENTAVDVPWSFAKEYVTSIGDYAFIENTALTSVNTTSKIDAIGDYAFNGCTALSNVTLYDSLTTLGVGCFYGDSALRSINIADTSIDAVPAYCFAECGFPTMRLPATCQSIGYHAFYNCSGLVRIDIPATVTDIADDAFTGCDNLIIVCPEGSAAAQYAEAKGIEYITNETLLMGDVNGDNKVNIRDVTFIQLYRVGLYNLVDNKAFLRADVDRNGVVNIRDATNIQLRLVDLIPDLNNI